jgi:hypothetical protein
METTDVRVIHYTKINKSLYLPVKVLPLAAYVRVIMVQVIGRTRIHVEEHCPASLAYLHLS